LGACIHKAAFPFLFIRRQPNMRMERSGIRMSTAGFRYLFFGGFSYGENIVETAKRELQEETGAAKYEIS
jgi:8-oxo-dGTP pyrophosphatase MutT (NUDIX family)